MRSRPDHSSIVRRARLAGMPFVLGVPLVLGLALLSGCARGRSVLALDVFTENLSLAVVKITVSQRRHPVSTAQFSWQPQTGDSLGVFVPAGISGWVDVYGEGLDSKGRTVV